MKKEKRSGERHLHRKVGYVEALKLLTPREIEVLERIRKGDTGKEIADSLGISKETVHSHRKNIKVKLGVQGCRALIKWWANTT